MSIVAIESDQFKQLQKEAFETGFMQCYNLIKGDEWMTADDVCAYLKVSNSWLYKKRDARRTLHTIPSHGDRKTLRFKKTEVDEWFQNSNTSNHERNRIQRLPKTKAA